MPHTVKYTTHIDMLARTVSISDIVSTGEAVVLHTRPLVMG